MSFKNRFAMTVCAAASAMILTAAGGPGTPIGAGAGVQKDADTGDLRAFSFNVVERPDGTVVGHAHISTNSGLVVHWDVTSYMFDDAGNLLMAGPITQSNFAPEGWTAFIGVQDNGAPFVGMDKTTGGSALPPELGTTIEDIIDLLGPPPPEAFVPISNGNIVVH